MVALYLKILMKTRLDKGSSNWSALGIIALCIFVLFAYSGENKGSGLNGWFSAPSYNFTTSNSGSSSTSGQKISSGSLSISSGNAQYSYQPYNEYVTISNFGNTSIDITGWQLKNGKDKRTYNLGGQIQKFGADIAIIPKATLVLEPIGRSLMQDVVLAPGERAVITTGGSGITTPYKIVSFKENMCTGYLGRLDDYKFEPSLSTNCPNPSQEPGVADLESSCRLFIQNLSPCHTPEKTRLDSYGKICDNCIDSKPVSSFCADFILSHFSYQGCVYNHRQDSNFIKNGTWRIYLGRSWELWDENFESIELYDPFGNLKAWNNY